MSDRVTAYAEAVCAGEIVAGRLVRLACERHLRDMKAAAAKGWTFDEKAVKRAVEFFTHLRHSKGEWANEPLILAPWQVFIVGSLIGWRRADGLRRFRLAYIEVARKNGKSTMLAGLGLYFLLFDGEPGAEVYCAATKRDQAKIVWGEAARMRDKSPALKRWVGKVVNNLHVIETASKMEPLGADADTMDGLNPHAVIIDEMHAHKNRTIIDVMQTALGSRRQPMQIEITTAGFDRQTVCWERRRFCQQVLEQALDDEATFAFIATIDDEDDWTDERCWAKANPNLGVSVKLDYLRAEASRAKSVAGEQNGFKRLHLDVWTESEDTWLSSEAWAAVEARDLRIEDYAGRKCWIGLDLAWKRDLCAMVQLFQLDDGSRVAFSTFWAPADGIVEREERDNAEYRKFRDQGYLNVTPGPNVALSFIAHALAEADRDFDIVGVACDHYKREDLEAELDEIGAGKIPLVDHPQGFRKQAGSDLWMPRSVAAAESLIVNKTIRIQYNPILRWNVASVVMTPDAEGNVKPDKRKSTGRIDGAVALIHAIALTAAKPEAKREYQFFVIGGHTSA